MIPNSVLAPNLNGKDAEAQIKALFEYAQALSRTLNFALKNIGTDNMEAEVSAVVQQAVDNSKVGLNTNVTENEFKSYITQTAKRIELKVSKDNVIGAINLTEEAIKISAGKISLTGYTSINDNFSVDTNGKFHALAGSVAGWTFEQNKGLYYGVNDADVSPQYYMGTVDLIKSVIISSSESRKDWRIKIGSNFGVTAAGDIYAENGYFRGKVDAKSIQYASDNSVSGEAVTSYTIVNSRMASHTLDEASIENAYATLKSDVSTMLQYYSGSLRAGYFYCSNINATGIITYRGSNLNLLTATISGTTIHYVGW